VSDILRGPRSVLQDEERREIHPGPPSPEDEGAAKEEPNLNPAEKLVNKHLRLSSALTFPTQTSMVRSELGKYSSRNISRLSQLDPE
jgi:hypothetical protein